MTAGDTLVQPRAPTVFTRVLSRRARLGAAAPLGLRLHPDPGAGRRARRGERLLDALRRARGRPVRPAPHRRRHRPVARNRNHTPHRTPYVARNRTQSHAALLSPNTMHLHPCSIVTLRCVWEHCWLTLGGRAATQARGVLLAELVHAACSERRGGGRALGAAHPRYGARPRPTWRLCTPPRLDRKHGAQKTNVTLPATGSTACACAPATQGRSTLRPEAQWV